ncbi:MAG: hypothetical protein E4H36_00505 [Spirochaetales bacterium]|nr:MAG: hypothetical protein E4H36_00505 [Spirochaetales bacterium]
MPEKVIIVTGERNGGKTSKMREIAAGYRSLGLEPAGILSVNSEAGTPDLPEPDKSRYFALDLASGTTRLLASEVPIAGEDTFRLGRFYFSAGAFSWSSSVIEAGFSAPVLMIDELGPVELAERGFWKTAARAAAGFRGILVLSIRDRFLELFTEKLGIRPGIIKVT